MGSAELAIHDVCVCAAYCMLFRAHYGTIREAHATARPPKSRYIQPAPGRRCIGARISFPN